MRDEFRIISVDAPGHGKTAAFASGEQYEMNGMADWLNGVVEELGTSRFFFLSHSWGSFVALFFTARFPHHVLDNIMIDGGYQGKRHSDLTMEEEVAYYEADFEQEWKSWDDFLALVKSETLSWSDLKLEAAKDLYLEKRGHYYWHARGETASHIVRAMYKDEAEDIYHKLDSSILLLRATLPQTLEKKRHRSAAILQEKTGAGVKLIEGTHLLHWDYPEQVVEEIRNRWSNKEEHNI
ncbi:lipase [Bacillus sp. KH172YL63]|nr:lipase [Bacillus sp. KH172YL63]